MSATDTLLPGRACSRTFQIEDMTVRSDGSGRVVESYFAVFAPVRSEVMDQDGHYLEENSPRLFTKTLAERGLNIPVFYNHARTLDGTPAGELSVPIGTPLEIRADERGVFNAVRYLDNPLADSILDGIRNRAINGMSYSGRFVKSMKSWPSGRGRGKLPLIQRQEAAIREFGPTAVPQFPEAAILGTRAQQVLRMLLANPTDETLSYLHQFEGLTTPDGEPEDLTSDTSDEAEAVETEEPHPHSARSIPLSTRIRAARIARGWE
jgi:HK97 family phage prohead protease